MKLGLWSLFATRRRFWGGMELYRLREFMRDSRQKKTKAAMKRVINCKKTWLPHFWKTKKSGFCKAWGTLLIQSYLATLTQWEVFVCYWHCGIIAVLQNELLRWTQLDSILLTGIFNHRTWSKHERYLHVCTHLSSRPTVMPVHDSSWTVSPRSGVGKLFWEPAAKLDVTTTAWPGPTLIRDTAVRTIAVAAFGISSAAWGGDSVSYAGCCDGVQIRWFSTCWESNQ